MNKEVRDLVEMLQEFYLQAVHSEMCKLIDSTASFIEKRKLAEPIFQSATKMALIPDQIVALVQACEALGKESYAASAWLKILQLRESEIYSDCLCSLYEQEDHERSIQEDENISYAVETCAMIDEIEKSHG